MYSHESREFLLGFSTRFNYWALAINIGFLVLGLYLVCTAGQERMRVWRALAMLLVGGTALVSSIMYIQDVSLRMNQTAWETRIFGSGAMSPQRIRILFGPYISAALAGLLLLLGAIELRGWLVRRHGGA